MAMILYPRGVGPVLYDRIVGACSAAASSRRSSSTAPLGETAVDLAANGLGLTWAPKVFAARRSADVAILAVTDPLPVLPCAIGTVRGRREASTRMLIDRIVAEARARTNGSAR